MPAFSKLRLDHLAAIGAFPGFFAGGSERRVGLEAGQRGRRAIHVLGAHPDRRKRLIRSRQLAQNRPQPAHLHHGLDSFLVQETLDQVRVNFVASRVNLFHELRCPWPLKLAQRSVIRERMDFPFQPNCCRDRLCTSEIHDRDSQAVDRRRSKNAWLLDRARANGGLAPVELDRFWADKKVADADPFGLRIPQLALGIAMSGECVYDELGVAEDYWRYEHDDNWRLQLNRAYNDRAERIVGRRLLSESPRDASLQYPPIKGLHDLFEAKNIWHGQSWWLMQSSHSEDGLKALLDRVERRLEDVRGFILPPNREAENARLRRYAP